MSYVFVIDLFWFSTSLKNEDSSLVTKASYISVNILIKSSRRCQHNNKTRIQFRGNLVQCRCRMQT